MTPSPDVVDGLLRNWLPKPPIRWYLAAYRSVQSQWKPVRFHRMLRVHAEFGQLEFALVEDGWYGKNGDRLTLTKHVYLCGMVHFTLDVDMKTRANYFYQ